MCIAIVPCKDKAHVRVGSAGACWTPLDCVDLLTVGLQVVNTCVLLHRPNL